MASISVISQHCQSRFCWWQSLFTMPFNMDSPKKERSICSILFFIALKKVVVQKTLQTRFVLPFMERRLWRRFNKFSWQSWQLTKTALINRISTCNLLLQRNEKEILSLNGLVIGDKTSILYQKCIQNTLGLRETSLRLLWSLAFEPKKHFCAGMLQAAFTWSNDKFCKILQSIR